MKALALLALVISLFDYCSYATEPVIYGQDNRKDLYEVLNPAYRKLADSTVAIIDAGSLSQNASGMVTIKSMTLQKRMNVCTSEPFFDQPVAVFCSGSLIGPDLILTASHCIPDQETCNHTKFVFGFEIDKEGVYPKQASESEIYNCKSILHLEQSGVGVDFALVLTAREVTTHVPLKLADRSSSTIAQGSGLLLIGHPVGLPTKVDDGGSVRDSSPHGYFLATTDSYSGSSGSPVINLTTLEVEGVLVGGENDFVTRNHCLVSQVCAENACRGEHVTKISSIAPSVLGTSRH